MTSGDLECSFLRLKMRFSTFFIFWPWMTSSDLRWPQVTLDDISLDSKYDLATFLFFDLGWPLVTLIDLRWPSMTFFQTKNMFYHIFHFWPWMTFCDLRWPQLTLNYPFWDSKWDLAPFSFFDLGWPLVTLDDLRWPWMTFLYTQNMI